MEFLQILEFEEKKSGKVRSVKMKMKMESVLIFIHFSFLFFFSEFLMVM